MSSAPQCHQKGELSLDLIFFFPKRIFSQVNNGSPLITLDRLIIIQRTSPIIMKYIINVIPQHTKTKSVCRSYNNWLTRKNCFFFLSWRNLFTYLIHQQFPAFHPELLFLDPNSDKNPNINKTSNIHAL